MKEEKLVSFLARIYWVKKKKQKQTQNIRNDVSKVNISFISTKYVLYVYAYTYI